MSFESVEDTIYNIDHKILHAIITKNLNSFLTELLLYPLLNIDQIKQIAAGLIRQINHWLALGWSEIKETISQLSNQLTSQVYDYFINPIIASLPAFELGPDAEYVLHCALLGTFLEADDLFPVQTLVADQVGIQDQDLIDEIMDKTTKVHDEKNADGSDYHDNGSAFPTDDYAERGGGKKLLI